MMKKRFFIIALFLVLLGVPTIALASNISGARYYGIIHIQNDSTATTNVATTCNISTQNLIDGDYLNASANNCVIRTSAGADMPFMPAVNATNPWCLWVASIGTGASQTDILYTANSTGGKIRYFPDTGGMTAADNETLELGDNFTVEQKGWVQTTFSDNYSNRNLVYKEDAVRTYISGAGNITTQAEMGVFALDFDGTADYVEIGDKVDFKWLHGALDAANFKWTVEFWMKMPNAEPNAMYGLVDTGAAAQANIGITLMFDDRAAAPASRSFRLNIYNGVTPVVQYKTPDNKYPNDTDWHYIVFTYNQTLANANAEIFVDSISAGTGDKTAQAPSAGNSTHELHIGSFGDENSEFVGEIDELRISDKVRSQAEIDAAYNGGSGDYLDVDGNTVALWHFNKGAGGTAYDETTNNHDGTIVNASWTTGFITSSREVTATGISSGERRVVTTADTVNLTISVYDSDDVLIASDSTALAANVTDNSAIWTFLQNNVMPYMEYQKISINGTLKQHIVWEYDTTFNDLSGYDNDATPTFRTASSDADVSAELVSFQPVAEAKAPDYILGAAPPFIDVGITGNVTGTFTTTPGAGTFPLAGIIIAVATATKTPPQLPLLIIAVFIILAASLTVSALMRQYGSGSLIVKIGVIVVLMGIFIALGNFAIDFWMLVVFLIIAVSIAFMSKQVGWT